MFWRIAEKVEGIIRFGPIFFISFSSSSPNNPLLILLSRHCLYLFTLISTPSSFTAMSCSCFLPFSLSFIPPPSTPISLKYALNSPCFLSSHPFHGDRRQEGGITLSSPFSLFPPPYTKSYLVPQENHPDNCKINF